MLEVFCLSPIFVKSSFLLSLLTVFLCSDTAKRLSWQDSSVWKLEINCFIYPTPRSAGSLSMVRPLTKSLNLMKPGMESHTTGSSSNQSKSSPLSPSFLKSNQLCGPSMVQSSGSLSLTQDSSCQEDMSGNTGFHIGRTSSLGMLDKPVAIQLL